MTVPIGDANIAKVRLAEQGSDPATPPSGFAYLFVKSDGGQYLKNDGGVVSGPFGPALDLVTGTSTILDATTTLVLGNQLTVSVTGTVAFVNAPAFVAAKYVSDAAQVITNNATIAIINFEDKIYDTNNAVTTGASWKFTAPIAGYYQVNALVQFALDIGWEAGERALLQLFKNGVAAYTLDRKDDDTNAALGSSMTVSGSLTISLALNDYIDIRVAQNSGGDIALATDQKSVWVDITRLG